MTFDAREKSRSRGLPVNLYKFTVGTVVYGYTDAEDMILWGGDEYDPIAVDRDAITSSGTLDKSSMRLSVPNNIQIAELFRVFPPSDVVGLTIFERHLDDPDEETLAVWSGRVLSGGRKDSETTLTCEPVSTSMRRPGLRRRYQYGCPHALYGPSCGVLESLFTVDATVLSVSGAFVLLEAGWNAAFNRDDFTNGKLKFTSGEVTEIRQVLQVNADEILMAGAIGGLQTGDVLNISLGCNHQESGCNVFDNIHNFGGQPWIPKSNPLGNVSHFY